MLSRHVSSVIAVLLLGLSVASACEADRPDPSGGTFPPAGQGRTISLARCSPGTVCPGPDCASKVLGAPDGLHLDLQRCPVLDVAWTGGTVVSSTNMAHIALHVGQVSGLTRVEASDDGIDYVIVGFVGGVPGGTSQRCLSQLSGTRVLVALDRCNTLSQATMLRLTRDSAVQGSLKLDAVEALAFVTAK